jgi:hypothetical protein
MSPSSFEGRKMPSLSNATNRIIHCLRTEIDPVSETLPFIVFGIPEDVQSPEPQ